jgi:Pyruvate/2-oxoacid:ferredoxin oxidoreductase delta subunit
MIIKSFDHISYIIPALILIAAHVRLAGKNLEHTGPVQYLLHKFYAAAEPTILRITDFLITKKIITGTAPGMAFLRFVALLSHYLPHGVIVTTNAAEKFFDYIENVEGPAGARIAVGPCVCQRSLNKWKEPSYKDIVILYGADIYRYLDLGYRVISASEAGEIVRRCREEGLVHSIDFCMQSGKWAFVVCNCDRDICVLTRTFLLTGKFIYPGPEIVTVDANRCLGEKRCGQCIRACIFGANSSTGDKPSADYTQCQGCGQCARVCSGKARTMSRRELYGREGVVPAEILLG